MIDPEIGYDRQPNYCNMKITKRDIKFFILGIVSVFVIETVWNWPENLQAFKDGWNGARTEKNN